MLACQHFCSRIFLILPIMTVCFSYQGFSIARTEGMFSLNQSFSSQWNRSHALSKIAWKCTFADVNKIGYLPFLI